MQRAHAGKSADLIIRGMPGITYGHAVRASQTIFIKINHITFSECAEKDSHCRAQQEHGYFK